MRLDFGDFPEQRHQQHPSLAAPALRHTPPALALICAGQWRDVGGAQSGQLPLIPQLRGGGRWLRRAARATPDTARSRLEVIAKIHSGMVRSRSDTDRRDKTKSLMNI